jgi:hypothetical protein
MSTAAIVLAAVTAAGFVLLLRAIGHAVTAIAARVPSAHGQPRQYLAGRLDGVQIITVVAYDGELLAGLASQAAGPLAGVFRITASTCSLARVMRWREEGTPLRAYLSQDGAIMLADPVLGGNAACEPSITPAQRLPERRASPDQLPTEDK